jgi:hypothetical protein
VLGLGIAQIQGVGGLLGQTQAGFSGLADIHRLGFEYKRRSKSAPGGGLIVRHRGYTYPFHNHPSNIFSAHFL